MKGDLSRFGLLASAIAGRLVDVAAAEAGGAAWTDGTSVFIDPDTDPSEQLRCVALQASLLGAGSLEPGLVAGLRRPATIRRYLAVEGHRALATVRHLLPPAVVSMVDPRSVTRTDSPLASLDLARSRAAVEDPPSWFGTIRPRRMRDPAKKVPSEAEGVGREGSPRVQDAGLTELDDDAEIDEQTTLDLISGGDGGGGALGRLVKRMLGDARTASGGQPGSDSPTRWARQATRRRGTVLATSLAASDTEVAVTGGATGTTYPEWDVHRRRYRPDWCTVVEVDNEPGDPFPVGDIGALRRSLARLGVELERRRRQMQGDDIDIDAVVESFVDAKAGTAPDEALYTDSLRVRRDLGVLVLLDISGSTGEPSALRGTVHEHQRKAAAVLTAALSELGDRVALYGFRSQGRTAVQVVGVKRFDDHLGPLVIEHLGALVPGAYTRLGAAIRHGAAVLERESGTSRRLLVVLSDGFAYDHGYEGAYGEADARRALVEARRRGTGCVCLSIGTSSDPVALRRVFGSAAHAMVPRTELLPGVVASLFRSALRSAEAQHRAHQRRERSTERLEIERMVS